ncbi:PREDICTED: sapecin-like [Bactrocera latifrons]|uniref:sapecin-like n=1 Tax=Bactrocera latifrons TaxID=174628 RepID=UPI0008DCB48F|nr:PREDICTED: sapecin-like [Bactrocera latifrons]
MKTLVLFAGLVCALCMFTVAQADDVDGVAEVRNDLGAPLTVENVEPLRSLRRQKRFTCDVLESTEACIFHCLLLGRRGGYCSRQKVCICRL